MKLFRNLSIRPIHASLLSGAMISLARLYSKLVLGLLVIFWLQTTANADLVIPQCAGGSFGSECSLTELLGVGSFNAYGASFTLIPNQTFVLDPDHTKVVISSEGNNVAITFERYDATGNFVPLVSLNEPGNGPHAAFGVGWSIRPTAGRYISGASLTTGQLVDNLGWAQNSVIFVPSGSHYQALGAPCENSPPLKENCGLLITSDIMFSPAFFNGFDVIDVWATVGHSTNTLDDHASVLYSTVEFVLVPEPSTMSLLGVAVLLFSVVGLRYRIIPWF